MQTKDLAMMLGVGMMAYVLMKSIGPKPAVAAQQPQNISRNPSFPISLNLGSLFGGMGVTNDPYAQQWATNSSWISGVSSGWIADANNASVIPSAMDGGMSVDPSSFTGQWMAW